MVQIKKIMPDSNMYECTMMILYLMNLRLDIRISKNVFQFGVNVGCHFQSHHD